MEVLQIGDKDGYKKTQIEASQEKFEYCKFSFVDAEKYLDIINKYQKYRQINEELGPILSLGVRNGREVNCFRITNKGSRLFKWLVRNLELNKAGMQCMFPFLENLDHSDFGNIGVNSSVGVEINPQASRKDIWIGSFDEMPENWYGRFRIIYTNAFDHSFDPNNTIEIWKKYLAKGGFMIFCFPEDQIPQEIDPVGKVTLDDVL